MRRSLWICALLLSVLASSDLRAQVRPGATQPGQVERQLARPPEPSSQPGAINLPATGQAAPPNAAGIRFVLKQVVLHGVTAYKPDEFRKLQQLKDLGRKERRLMNRLWTEIKVR